MAIRIPKNLALLAVVSSKRDIFGNGLPHQSADWFAMTGGDDLAFTVISFTARKQMEENKSLLLIGNCGSIILLYF